MDFETKLHSVLAVAINLQLVALHEGFRVQQEQEEAEEEARRIKKRRYGVHPLWRSRETEGELVLFRQMLMDDEEKFYGYFRMSRDCFSTLLRKIEDQLVKKSTNWKKNPISPEERLAVCLRYLATGDSQKTLSYSFRMGHSTVSKIVKETCRVITTTLLSEIIPMPTMEKWETIRAQFWDKCKFPNCLGAIDGKYVKIQAPPKSGSLYNNYKKNFSVVLMAVADADCNFVAVEVGAYGKNSDGGILAKSNLGRKIADGTFPMLPDTNLPGTSICAPCVIVGNEAFPLKRNILRPYPGNKADGHQDRGCFNTRLSTARRVVENAFEILSQKFQIYNGRIKARPENVDYIIMATCILHNYIRAYEGSATRSREEETARPTWDSLSHQGGNATRECFSVRETFKDFIFQSSDSHTGAT